MTTKFSSFFHSDVHLVLSTNGNLRCCACGISKSESSEMNSVESYVEHLRKHIKKGHRVPDSLIKHLQDNSDAITKQINLKQ